MVYWFIRLDTTDMTLQMDRICANWERIRRQPFTIRAINRYALDVEALPEGRPGSLAAELKKLPVEEDFLLILLEVFSDYTYQMNCLRELIMPIARRLQALLEPFVAQAEPLRETWDRFFPGDLCRGLCDEASGNDFGKTSGAGRNYLAISGRPQRCGVPGPGTEQLFYAPWCGHTAYPAAGV